MTNVVIFGPTHRTTIYTTRACIYWVFRLYLDILFLMILRPAVFNLFDGAEQQGNIPDALGTPVHIYAEERRNLTSIIAFISSSGTSGMYWRNPKVPREP